MLVWYRLRVRLGFEAAAIGRVYNVFERRWIEVRKGLDEFFTIRHGLTSLARPRPS
jgi:hypothetical protein